MACGTAPEHAAASPESAAAPASVEPLAPCARLWTRPDRAIADRASCRLEPGPEAIARAGGLVLLGSAFDASQMPADLRPANRCVPYTHEGNGRLVSQTRAARRPGDPPTAFVHLHRFDIVQVSQASLPGFDAGFLVRTKRPLDEIERFFAQDSGTGCRTGCRWSDSTLGDAGRGPRLRDLVDASGGEGSHRTVVYYVARPNPESDVFWPLAAMGDLRNPAYRAWRIAEAKRAMALGGYDAIMLNQKFSQFRKPYWIGPPHVPDVAAVRFHARDTLWTGQPDGYGYPEYVHGWASLGEELRAAGVPYAVWIAASAWRSPGSYDARETPDVDESELVRATARGARIVLLEHQATEEERRRIEAELRAAGVHSVVRGEKAREGGCPAPPP